MILERFGGTERFAVATVPAPVPKRGEVLVTIKAAGVNPIDVKTRRGGGIADSLRRQRPMILGWDLSGVVSKTGEGVEEFRIGDPVFGTVNFPGLRKILRGGNCRSDSFAVYDGCLCFTDSRIPEAEGPDGVSRG